MLDIAILNRVIRESIIVYVIFEYKLEGIKGRTFQEEKRAKRKPFKLIYLTRGKEANLCG